MTQYVASALQYGLIRSAKLKHPLKLAKNTAHLRVVETAIAFKILLEVDGISTSCLQWHTQIKFIFLAANDQEIFKDAKYNICLHIYMPENSQIQESKKIKPVSRVTSKPNGSSR